MPEYLPVKCNPETPREGSGHPSWSLVFALLAMISAQMATLSALMVMLLNPMTAFAQDDVEVRRELDAQYKRLAGMRAAGVGHTVEHPLLSLAHESGRDPLPCERRDSTLKQHRNVTRGRT